MVMTNDRRERCDNRMKQFTQSWVFMVIVACLFVFAVGAIIIWSDNQNNEDDLFSPLFDFCYYQLRDVVSSCADWSNDFILLYGDKPEECLRSFEPDSSLLTMCIYNIIEGNQ